MQFRNLLEYLAECASKDLLDAERKWLLCDLMLSIAIQGDAGYDVIIDRVADRVHARKRARMLRGAIQELRQFSP